MANLFFSRESNSRNRKILLSATLFTLFALPGALAQPLKVVATIGMVADVVKNVGQGCVEVSVLMGPGIDPHLYKASAGDVRTLNNADVIFYSGYNLEGQLGEVLEGFKKRKTVVAVAEAVISSDETLLEDGHTSPDPHLWMDVSLWARTADVIASTLALSSPDCQEAPANASAYKTQLEGLHLWIKQSIATIPTEQRILVTAHDAFFYYSRAYDIEVAAIQGVSTQSEASIEDIRSTVDTVITRKVPAIFVESSINPRTIEAVLQSAKDKGHQVVIGGQLYSDAMGQDGTENGTYIGMLYHNTQAIVTALGGQSLELPETLKPWAAYWSEQ